MLDYKKRKMNEKAAGNGRINLEIPIDHLKELKLLAVEWRCMGIDEANVSNFVRAAINLFLTSKNKQEIFETIFRKH